MLDIYQNVLTMHGPQTLKLLHVTRLLSHLQAELLTRVLTNVRIVVSVQKNVLPEDGAISAEICGRVLLVIHVFY